MFFNHNILLKLKNKHLDFYGSNAVLNIFLNEKLNKNENFH